jgi:hypothetical protein
MWWSSCRLSPGDEKLLDVFLIRHGGGDGKTAAPRGQRNAMVCAACLRSLRRKGKSPKSGGVEFFCCSSLGEFVRFSWTTHSKGGFAMKRYWFFLAILLALVTAFAVAACGDDDDDDDNDAADDDDNDDNDNNDNGDDDDDNDTAGDDDDDDDDDDTTDPWGDWWPPAAGQTFLYQVFEWQGFTSDMELSLMGEESHDGGTYTKIQLGDFTAEDIVGFQGWFDFSTPGQIGFNGANIYWTNTKLADTEPNGIFDLDDNVVIYLNLTLDEPQVDTGTGSWTIWGIPSTFSTTLTSTTLDNDASVTVPYGTVDHCMKVQVGIHEEFSEWPSFDGTAVFYFHKDLGMVKLEGSQLMGFSFDLKDVL